MSAVKCVHVHGVVDVVVAEHDGLEFFSSHAHFKGDFEGNADGFLPELLLNLLHGCAQTWTPMVLASSARVSRPLYGLVFLSQAHLLQLALTILGTGSPKLQLVRDFSLFSIFELNGFSRLDAVKRLIFSLCSSFLVGNFS